MRLLEQLANKMRCCAGCGRMTGEVQWLCCKCELELLKRLKPQRRKMFGKVEHHFWLEWDPQDQFLSPLVYSLKGNGLVTPYSFLWSRKSESRLLNEYDFVFYPSKGGRDHAQILAGLWAESLEVEYRPSILKKGAKQALLRKNQRKTREFQQVSVPKNSRVLVVDDIVTTGATIQACLRAFEQPIKPTVWSLFCRKSL